MSFTKTTPNFRTENNRIYTVKSATAWTKHIPLKHPHSHHMVQITHLWSKGTNQFYTICWPSLSLQRRILPPPLSWHLPAGSSAWLTETWWPFPALCPLPAGSERRGPQEYLDSETAVDGIISTRAKIYKTMGTRTQTVNLRWSSTHQANGSSYYEVRQFSVGESNTYL